MRATLCTVIVLVTGGTSVSARTDDRTSLEAYAALEYDGRVRVDELDIDQREGDLVGLLNRRDGARLDIEYRDRDYERITPSIAARRREERLVMTGTSDLHLSDRVGVRTIVRYTDRNSNFPASNYEEIRASTGFVVRL